MVSASDILKLLDKVPLWQKLTHLPEKYAALEVRVKQLEEKIKYSPGSCPSCSSVNFSATRMKRGEQKPNLRKYGCQDCGYTEVHKV